MGKIKPVGWITIIVMSCICLGTFVALYATKPWETQPVAYATQPAQNPAQPAAPAKTQAPAQPGAAPVKTQIAQPAPVKTQIAQATNEVVVGGGGAPSENQVEPSAEANLPTFTLGIDTYAPYFPGSIIMKMKGFDKEHGFNLNMIRFYSADTGSELDESARTALMQDGTVMQALATTLDKALVADNIGQITIIIGTSDGLDSISCRAGINIFNELKGARIGVLKGSVGQFFAEYVAYSVLIPVDYRDYDPNRTFTPNPDKLNIVGYNALVTDEDEYGQQIIGAVNDFNAGNLDCVSGWEPDSLAALPPEGFGHQLTNSHYVKVPVDVIVTSYKAINETPELVQAYHDAYCEAVKYTVEHPEDAEAEIIKYGDPSWTYVAAQGDWLSVMIKHAFATCSDNFTLMAKVNSPDDPLTDRLVHYQEVLATSGEKVVNLDRNGLSSLINPSFIMKAHTITDYQTNVRPVNATFTLSSQVDVPPFTAQSQGLEFVMAQLPFDKIKFNPNSVYLTDESKRLLDTYVVPLLKTSPYVYLRLYGSAAFPQGNQYNASGVIDTARLRTLEIFKYLGQCDQYGKNCTRFDADRFIVEWIETPPERCTQVNCEQFRYVRFELISLGY